MTDFGMHVLAATVGVVIAAAALAIAIGLFAGWIDPDQKGRP